MLVIIKERVDSFLIFKFLKGVFNPTDGKTLNRIIDPVSSKIFMFWIVSVSCFKTP